ncbi:MAG TPA: two-component regulator propeller domain-containing protein, partial [Chryseosolibacter sp.]|nr:two-component regulator propeller domain-containing protein [Chryseosolibacter sp.]
MSTIALLFVVFLMACNEEEPDLIHQSQINQWQFLDYEHGLPSNHVNEIFEDSQGRLWFGTNRGLSMLRDKQLTTYTGGHGLLDNNVFAITEDRDGNIWVGTPNGVNIFVDNQWQYFPFFYQAPVYDIIALQDGEGMLIGTGGFGVYKYDYETSTFSRFNVIRQCRACNTINSLFQAK